MSATRREGEINMGNGLIPPNSTVIFEIQLLNLTRPGDDDPYIQDMVQDVVSQLNFDDDDEVTGDGKVATEATEEGNSTTAEDGGSGPGQTVEEEKVVVDGHHHDEL